MVCLGVKLNFWTIIGGLSIGGKTQNEPPNHPTVTDEISLRRTIEYDNESHYIITQVGTIRRCITAVKNEVPMEPLENRNPSLSTAKLRFPISSVLKNLQNQGDKLFSFYDSSSGHSSSDQKCIQNQNTAQNGSPVVTSFQHQNCSMPSNNNRATFQVKHSSIPEVESNFGSGDNLSCNFGDTNSSIQDHWNNVLQQLNCNISRRKPTVRIMNSRSVIHRKKYK